MCAPSEYQNLEETEESNVAFAAPNSMKVGIVVDSEYPGKAAVDTKAPVMAKDQQAQQRMGTDPAPSTAHAAAFTFMTPRDEDEIVCGIDLEAAKSDFQFNGVKHPAGTLRIVRLHKDGVCEVRLVEHHTMSHDAHHDSLDLSACLAVGAGISQDLFSDLS
jgi:hypothetical protein